jgi:hypothetical protein
MLLTNELGEAAKAKSLLCGVASGSSIVRSGVWFGTSDRMRQWSSMIHVGAGHCCGSLLFDHWHAPSPIEAR